MKNAIDYKLYPNDRIIKRYIRVSKYIKRIGEGWLPTDLGTSYPTTSSMRSSIFIDLANEPSLTDTFLGKIQVTYYVKFKGRKPSAV